MLENIQQLRCHIIRKMPNKIRNNQKIVAKLICLSLNSLVQKLPLIRGSFCKRENKGENTMKDFKEAINGRNYTIEEAKEEFIRYALRHNSQVSKRARNVVVKTYKDSLPNGSKAFANSNAKENRINMLAGKNSIITFFHEFKHIADSWKDEKGTWHTNWEHEDDYNAQMSYSDYHNKIIHINRGVKGMAIGEATAELYATKIYWELCGYSNTAIAETRRRTTYDEEIITLKKIATVLGIDEDQILAWKSENDYGRNMLKILFTKLTGDRNFWTELEYRMDYVVMLTFIKLSHSQLKIDDESLRNIERYREDIKNMLRKCLLKEKQKEYLLSYGCTLEEFEVVYSQRITEFQRLEKYAI